ncbi:unnamed protein product [Agarophyton chilense]
MLAWSTSRLPKAGLLTRHYRSRTQHSLSVRSSRDEQPLVFGYRRPPPWKLERPNQVPSSTERQSYGHAREDISTWPQIRHSALVLSEIRTDQDASIIPQLAHGMDAVLKGDGLYPLEAPWVLSRRVHPNHTITRWPPRRRRHSFCYKDSVRKITQPRDIAWWNIPEYIPASQDTTLHRIASETPGAKYSSSTSSISPAIAAMYHLLSNYRDTDLVGGLSAQLSDLPSHFSKYHRRPVAFTLSRNHRDRELYTVNAHSGTDSGPSILRDLGHSMERMLTMSPEEFSQRYVVSSQNDIDRNEQFGMKPSAEEKQFYHYSKASKFVLRAQIDCRNGQTGEVFDVKTRAVAKIRYDLPNYLQYTSHKLRFLRGKTDSYEREFYDMVRTVFLKYALQLRIGRMSGALVAYHNTTELLGLEYISLKEIESYVFGNSRWADIAFGTAVHLLEKVLATVTDSLPLENTEDRLKVMLYTEWSKLKMFVFVQRLGKDEEDPFGDAEFKRRERESSATPEVQQEQISNLQAFDQWHVDSELHGIVCPGLSIVGAHDLLKQFGGSWIPGEKQDSKMNKRRPANSSVFNHVKFDFSSCNPNNLRAWELKVVPLVNDEEHPRKNISLNEGDTFRLKYNISEVTKLRAEHYSKFIGGLARIYLR